MIIYDPKTFLFTMKCSITQRKDNQFYYNIKWNFNINIMKLNDQTLLHFSTIVNLD